MPPRHIKRKGKKAAVRRKAKAKKVAREQAASQALDPRKRRRTESPADDDDDALYESQAEDIGLPSSSQAEDIGYLAGGDSDNDASDADDYPFDTNEPLRANVGPEPP